MISKVIAFNSSITPLEFRPFNSFTAEEALKNTLGKCKERSTLNRLFNRYPLLRTATEKICFYVPYNLPDEKGSYLISSIMDRAAIASTTVQNVGGDLTRQEKKYLVSLLSVGNELSRYKIIGFSESLGIRLPWNYLDMDVMSWLRRYDISQLFVEDMKVEEVSKIDPRLKFGFKVLNGVELGLIEDSLLAEIENSRRKYDKEANR